MEDFDDKSHYGPQRVKGLQCLSKEWLCKEELHVCGVGNFEFKPVIRKLRWLFWGSTEREWTFFGIGVVCVCAIETSHLKWSAELHTWSQSLKTLWAPLQLLHFFLSIQKYNHTVILCFYKEYLWCLQCGSNSGQDVGLFFDPEFILLLFLSCQEPCDSVQ